MDWLWPTVRFPLTLLAQVEEVPWYAGPMIPFIVIGVLFYLLLIRPEKRKRNELNQMLANLKKNDHVVTAGGIHGVVVNVNKDAEDVTLRVDESNNTRLRILRSHISRVITDDDAENKKETSTLGKS